MVNAKQEHLHYLKDKGKFVIDAKIKNLPAFTDEMVEIIEKYGHWFEALVEGRLQPITERQKMFIDAVKKDAPFSVEEQAWVLYIKRKSLAEGLSLALKRRIPIVEEPHYTYGHGEEEKIDF